MKIMIKKIKKIKNLWIFSDYSWDSHTLKDFERYNVFYGWNGTGKTTLTKLFSWLEEWWLSEYPTLEYEVEEEAWTGAISVKQGEKITDKVRVFNQAFIDANIEITGSKAKPIFILWEENKILKDEIDADEIILKDLVSQQKSKTEEKVRKENERGSKFTDVAKLIGSSSVGFSTRNYRKPDAEADFKAIKTKTLLTQSEILIHQTTLKEEQKEKIELVEYEIDINSLYDDAAKLLSETVSSVVIERLRQNTDISEWVETGITLHKTHWSDTCEYCQQKIPDARLGDLLNHFNEADKLLKEKIDEKIVFITWKLVALSSLSSPNKVLLYKELQTEYTSRLLTFNTERKNLELELSTIIQKLQEKKTKTTESLMLEKPTPNNFLAGLAILNETLTKNNSKTATFQAQKDAAYLAIKNHYLSEIYDEAIRLEVDIAMLSWDLIQLGKDELALRTKITTNKAKISSEHKACDILNKKLETFLGRKEIVFEVATGGWGYVLKRNWIQAKNLSEGEKTAIAFVYFTVHLDDQNFNLGQGIVVIDDPISSLDANSLFQAFAFLKVSVENAKQVFILTHNFDFLQLILNWVKNVYKNPQKKPYYMVSNNIVGSKRTASIIPLDHLLTDYESEYHYLCKKLTEFEASTCVNIEEVYHIPNIARKVLETFLMFRVPNGKNQYAKLKLFEDQTKFDKVKLTAIYKFTNDQSHITGSWFDPSLVQETQKNVRHLLDMIKETAPEHYSILISSF